MVSMVSVVKARGKKPELVFANQEVVSQPTDAGISGEWGRGGGAGGERGGGWRRSAVGGGGGGGNGQNRYVSLTQKFLLSTPLLSGLKLRTKSLSGCGEGVCEK